MKDKLSALLAWIFGGLIILGGIVGYIQAGSLVSVGAGFAFGVLMLASGTMIYRGTLHGRRLGVGTSALLTAVFCMRFVKTLAWIPSGALAILALTTTVGLVLLRPRQGREIRVKTSPPDLQ